MKILVIGNADNGKDSFCEILHNEFNLSYISSSQFANSHIVYPVLKNKYNYANQEHCFSDRVNHRGEWKDLIYNYNKDDLSRLTSEILNQFNVYCGMRHRDEFEACKHLFDLIIWVDASKRVHELDFSNDLNEHDAHVCVDNNGDLTELEESARRTIFTCVAV